MGNFKHSGNAKLRYELRQPGKVSTIGVLKASRNHTVYHNWCRDCRREAYSRNTAAKTMRQFAATHISHSDIL